MGKRLQIYLNALAGARKKYGKWLTTFLCLALAVTLTTSAILTVSGIAVTDSRAEDVGMVLEAPGDAADAEAAEVEEAADHTAAEVEEAATDHSAAEAEEASSDRAAAEAEEAASDAAEAIVDTAGPSSLSESTASAVHSELKAAEEDPYAAFSVAGTLENTMLATDGRTYRVSVGYDESAMIPDGAVLTVKEIPDDDSAYSQYVDQAAEALSAGGSRISCAKLFDITISKDGEEIQPASPVDVCISMLSEEVLENENQPETSAKVLHFGEEVEVLDGVTDIVEQENVNVSFRADGFSVYGVVYTVEFHYEINGKMYDFSIPGGGFVSLAHVVEVLGIASADENAENGAENAENGTENGCDFVGEVPGVDVSGGNSTAYEEAIKLNKVEVSEATRKFVADVESVEFSNPELVWVGKADEATTVGGIKENKELEIEYSANLTEEQIVEINAQTVEAGDWALISMQPFLSEESLTVTMKNGDQWTVRVTDGQIIRNVLTKDGETYRITIAYDDKAGIPDGTQLVVREIEPGTDEYLQHLGKAWREINKEYLEQEQKIKSYPDIPEDCIDIRPINLDQARFFDISLIYNDQEIEPKTAVQVDVKYVDGLKTSAPEEEQIFGVAHYMTNETELIGEVNVDRNNEGEIVEFSYEQSSFSGIGTFAGYQTSDKAPSDSESGLSMPGLRTLAKAMRNGVQLGEIEAHKHLNDNHDGTYTLSLTVKGDAVAEEKYNKTNVLFVMDRSSSMTKGIDYTPVPNVVPQSGVTYYGKSGGDYFTLGYYSYPTMFGTQYVFYNVNDLSPYTGTVYTGGTSRLAAEQQALSVLFNDLLDINDPDTPGKEDIIEISVISFADDRGKVSEGTEVHDWKHDKEQDLNTLLSAVNNTNTPSGTNWEDALIYAKELADAKKQAQPDEKVFVVFLTDGEPTAIYGESGGAHHYDSFENGRWKKIFNGILPNGQYYNGEHNTLGGFEYAYNFAKDDAKAIVDAGHDLYGIFTFNPGEDQVKYLKRLVNYAYTGVDKAYNDDGTDTDSVKAYFTNADTPQTLVESFNNIFTKISSVVGHGEVVITDGLQSPDAMTTTIEAGHAGGGSSIRYLMKITNFSIKLKSVTRKMTVRRLLSSLMNMSILPVRVKQGQGIKLTIR